MVKAEEFHNITQYAERHHNPSCSCNMKPVNFQSHDASTVESCDEFLLLNKVGSKTDITGNSWAAMAKNHFLILAQKYHPDKNSNNNQELCHQAMTPLNKSYSEIIQAIASETPNPMKVTINGKIYRKINQCTVTCLHHESFSIYGYPDDANKWRNKIKEMWGRSPTAIKHKAKKIGQQFGNISDSIYISVFDNGTIHVQGIMATQYAEEVIDPLLTQWFKPSSSTIDRKRFSDLLKKAISHFQETTPPITAVTSGNNSANSKTTRTALTKSSESNNILGGTTKHI